MRTRHGSAAVMVAASGIPQHGPVGMPCRRFMALMRPLAQAACVRRRSFRLHRDRNNCPEKRDKQQKSGGSPLHAVW